MNESAENWCQSGAESLKTLPDNLSGAVEEVWASMVEQLSIDVPRLDPIAVSEFTRVLACSDFIQKQSLRHPEIVAASFNAQPEKRLQLPAAFQANLIASIGEAKNEADILRILRQARNQRMLLIAWADIAGASVEGVIAALSELADCFIQVACDLAYEQLTQLYGIPVDADAVEQKLIIIGMGKLGANELNFSSDIDLIFSYPSAGDTTGSRTISNEEFFTRQCRLIIKLLDKQTMDGFVFRVDTRLRPFGDSGALVLSGDGMDMYYQGHAREWERYAMVKARLITGESGDKKSLQSMIKAFVYRRYLDYGVFDSIRVMKREIEAQLQCKGVEHNVKLGPGGIREVEFIGQAYQLIRGGRDRTLQHRGIVTILKRLDEKGHIAQREAEELTADYGYLRRLENHLQEIDDKQTHQLPQDEVGQARLVLAMRMSHWDELLEKTGEVMARVHQHFGSMVDFSSSSSTADEWDWLALDADMLGQILTARNITASRAIQQEIIQFCHSYPVRQLQGKGRQYLTKLLPLLVDALLLEGSHEHTLSAFLKMLETICNRAVYLILLVENKQVFEQLVRLAKLSPLIIAQVTKSPILLDELIDPESLYRTPSTDSLRVELDTLLSEVKQSDIEQQMEILRLFKQVNVLRIAAADLTNVIPLMVVSDKLTALAEVIVEKALLFSWQAICAQYGVPDGASMNTVSDFAVIGFGKMGGIELGFSSDLDVIFLHKDTTDDEVIKDGKTISLAEFYMRLGRKVISFVTMRTFSGRLYEMDLRLRPNGNSGLLVTSVSSFKTYQKTKAWTWEQQALIRARFVAGCAETGAVFKGIRKEVLVTTRDEKALRADVFTMREKMRVALMKTKNDCFDLKHGAGGIVDIEFVVQFGVLLNASRHETLLRYTDNVRLLLELHEIGFLSSQQEEGLSLAYKAYREVAHHAALAEISPNVSVEQVKQHIQLVSSVWSEIF